MSDEQIQQLEDHFPSLSGQAFAAARDKVRAAGQTVLQSEEGMLVKLFPDGRKEVVKQLDPPVRVKLGEKLIIR
ncbi:hypothetical protein JIN84_00640 [Luteolibacter yonseiensis]|uniref:Uncharacterized protein n=1 Tax=Luteolibacter yonseiensis TaxID=1144680 RepID=A0A934R2K9_9BACT|nr:hypothetical protein [Luteolibacter yonseiensis]MBK1814114.1 hypothetical protein [Luteolibacter yonseiensis]